MRWPPWCSSIITCICAAVLSTSSTTPAAPSPTLQRHRFSPSAGSASSSGWTLISTARCSSSKDPASFPWAEWSPCTEPLYPSREPQSPLSSWWALPGVLSAHHCLLLMSLSIDEHCFPDRFMQLQKCWVSDLEWEHSQGWLCRRQISQWTSFWFYSLGWVWGAIRRRDCFDCCAAGSQRAPPSNGSFLLGE